jgi:hypothetical protein
MTKAMIGTVAGGGTLALGAIMFFVGISGNLNSTSKEGDVALIVIGGLFGLAGIVMLVIAFMSKNEK